MIKKTLVLFTVIVLCMSIISCSNDVGLVDRGFQISENTVEDFVKQLKMREGTIDEPIKPSSLFETKNLEIPNYSIVKISALALLQGKKEEITNLSIVVNWQSSESNDSGKSDGISCGLEYSAIIEKSEDEFKKSLLSAGYTLIDEKNGVYYKAGSMRPYVCYLNENYECYFELDREYSENDEAVKSLLELFDEIKDKLGEK